MRTDGVAPWGIIMCRTPHRQSYCTIASSGDLSYGSSRLRLNHFRLIYRASEEIDSAA
jgi:hypothetical protein